VEAAAVVEEEGVLEGVAEGAGEELPEIATCQRS